MHISLLEGKTWGVGGEEGVGIGTGMQDEKRLF